MDDLKINSAEQHAEDTSIAEMVATDPAAARAACLRIVSSSAYVPRLGIAALCKSYAASAPEEGLAFVRELDSTPEAAEEAMISLATKWGSYDFDAVALWMADWKTELTYLRDQILGMLAAAQPVRCVQVWNLFSATALENGGNFYAIASAFAANGADGAANRLIELPEKERGCLLWDVFMHVVDSAAGHEPLRIELSRPWPPDILSGMATALAFRLDDPREAAELLIRFGASDGSPLRSVVKRLATVDLPAAIRLLASQPEDLAKTCYYDTWTHGAAPDPEPALRIALSQTGKRLRFDGCQTVLRQWAWQAPPAAAEAWSALHRDHRDIMTDDEWAEGAAYIAEQWASRSPEAGRAWAEAVPHDLSRTAALAALIAVAETGESQRSGWDEWLSAMFLQFHQAANDGTSGAGIERALHAIPPFKPPLKPPPLLE